MRPATRKKDCKDGGKDVLFFFEGQYCVAHKMSKLVSWQMCKNKRELPEDWQRVLLARNVMV